MVRSMLLCLMVFCAPQLLFAGAVATLDRSIAAFGESVQLVIKVDGSADEDPDLSVLQQDFDVLNRSQSSSYNYINGNFNRSEQWTIHLMPKHQGTLLIPSIPLGNMKTNALSLQVLKPNAAVAQQDKNIFLEVKVSKAEVYVQAQVVLTVKLFRAVNLAQAQLSEPEMPKVIIKKLGEDKNYETVFEQRRFVVTERKYALFPQKSGRLHIPALQFNGQIANGRSMFNTGGGRAVRVQSEAIEVNVLPLPSDWQQGVAWLPAENMSIREIWADGQTTQYKVGEPLTRTVELTALGLTAEQLPQMFSNGDVDGFKQYPDQPTLTTKEGIHGVMGIRLEKIALIPTKAGDLKLPSVKVFWWNTKTQSKQSVLIPARMVSVAEADQTQKATTITPVVIEQQSASPLVQNNDQPLMQTASYIWQVLSFAFALLWLVTLFLWWRKSARQVTSEREICTTIKLTPLSLKGAKEKLTKACAQGNVKEVSASLLAWGKVFYQDDTLRYISELKGKSDDLDVILLDLERYQYSQDKQNEAWSGDALLTLVSKLVPEKKMESKSSSFKSLYS